MERPSPPQRYLVVNADDFGLSEGTNRGVIRAHEHGIVTSTSLMVRQPAAEHAAAYSRGNTKLGVGLHLDFGEWVYRDGEWVLRYEVVSPDDPAAVAAEVERQVGRFVELVGRPPTHIDSHQHVHRSEPMRAIVRGVAERLRVPSRWITPRLNCCGGFYGQTGEGEPLPEAIGVESLVKLISGLPAGINELSCHPGDDPDLDSVYRLERRREVETLCDAAVRRAVGQAGIALCSFSDCFRQ